MASTIFSYLPLFGTHYAPLSLFAIANGQCLAFAKDAYAKIGGHASVRGEIIEDVALARRIKRARLRLRLFDGNRLIYCRMYQNWDEVLAGFGKNIFAGHRNNLFFLLISTAFHWLVFVVPTIWLMFALATGSGWQFPLLLGGTWFAVRAVTTMMTRQRLRDVLFTPLSVLLMTRIAVRSIVWSRRGQTSWKGRIIKQF
jgi:chlorobactene glucosyltransferase